MKALIQRVADASVRVNGDVKGSCDFGLLVYLGVIDADTDLDRDYLVNKIINLRIFEDEAGKMNHSLLDVDASILLISQFTLMANTKKGRRPSYNDAADPVYAKALYEDFHKALESEGVHCECGVFAAKMDVSYVNKGPVSILIDSKNP